MVNYEFDNQDCRDAINCVSTFLIISLFNLPNPLLQEGINKKDLPRSKFTFYFLTFTFKS